MKEPLLSILIHVYGVERWIERCAVSLFEQDYENIEYIFVDDCTQDNSMSVLANVVRDYPKRREQIIIVNHTVNKGLPTARRSGLAVATGDYVIHCDSDDWVSKDIYLKLYAEAEQWNADMVVCGYYESNGEGNNTPCVISDKFKENVCAGIISGQIRHYLFTKLVKHDVYNQVAVFPEFNMFEDIPISIQLALNCKSIRVVDEPLYYYFYNPTSISHITVTPEKFKQMFSNVNIAVEYVKNHPTYCSYKKELKHLKGWFKTCAWNLDKKTYFCTYPEENIYMFFDPYMTFRQKLGHLTKMLGIHGLASKQKVGK